MSWTDERVNLLKELWGEGKTAAEIAKLLGGVTRNAVIGKAHRLKLSGRVSPIQQNTRPETVEHRARETVRAVKTSAPRDPSIRAVTPETFIEGKRIKLVELREGHCRWPMGDPKDENFCFCGHDTLAGLPYCEHHAKIAFQVSSRGKLKVDELAAIDGDVIRKSANKK